MTRVELLPIEIFRNKTGRPLASRILLAAFLLSAGLSAGSAGAGELSGRDTIPERLLAGNAGPGPYPPAPTPPPGHLVPPPSLNPYFYVRPDGQPYFLVQDATVNLTDALNRYYWNPDIEGEVWAPVDFCTTMEKSSRMMATWPDYDEFSWIRRLNKVHKKLERFAGYGP